MVNSARRSIPFPEDYDHKSTSTKVLRLDRRSHHTMWCLSKGSGHVTVTNWTAWYVCLALIDQGWAKLCMYGCLFLIIDVLIKGSHASTMVRHSFSICTDEWPLLPIFNKPICNAPKRLQWMLPRLQKYIRTEFLVLSRTENNIADILSHAYLQEQSPTNKTDYQIYQLHQEAQLYEEIDPALHVRLSKPLRSNSQGQHPKWTN